MVMLDQVMKPTEEISVRDVFGIDTEMRVKGFAERTDRVPEIDPTYKFDPDTCLLYTSPSPRDRTGSRMPSSA